MYQIVKNVNGINHVKNVVEDLLKKEIIVDVLFITHFIIKDA